MKTGVESFEKEEFLLRPGLPDGIFSNKKSQFG
jgi:hypothetical protein